MGDGADDEQHDGRQQGDDRQRDDRLPVPVGRTLVLAGGPERARGEDELAAMGAAPMAPG